MSRLMPLLLLIVPLLLLALALTGALVSLLRWLFRIGVAAVVTLVAGLILQLSPDQSWVLPAVFVATLGALSLRRRTAPARTAPVRAAPRPVRSVATTPPVPPPSAAWTDFRRLADWGARRRIDTARERCARYLALAETEEDESAQLPLRLRKHVPAMIEDCVRHCRTATRDEQRSLVAQTLASVEGVAGQAERRRLELAHQAQTRFRALQAHLAREGD